jgi:7-cyano-7-deazaguanine synthase
VHITSFTEQSAVPTAVVLLSGGLDSTTVLAIALREGFAVHALTFQYGQRHAAEIDAAKRIARNAGVARHHLVEIDLTLFGASALTADIPVPKDRDLTPSSPSAREIPITYVPARNTIFLSYALALAEVVGASEIFIGVNALDYSGYPDCRPEYIQAFGRMANLATRAGVEGRTKLVIRTPLISLSKAAIIKLGTSLGVDYSETTSCYDPGPAGEACGRCDACQLRLKGFGEAGLEDPIRYASPLTGSGSAKRAPETAKPASATVKSEARGSAR